MTVSYSKGPPHGILRGTSPQCYRAGRDLLLITWATQECVVLEPQSYSQNSFLGPNAESLWCGSKPSMFMIGARKHHEGWWASDVVLATQQNQQAPSVSLCTEESVTVHCAKTECWGHMWLNHLSKKAQKPAVKRPLSEIFQTEVPRCHFFSLCINNVSNTDWNNHWAPWYHTVEAVFPSFPTNESVVEGATGEVLSTFLTTSGPCYKDYLITR